MKDYKEIYRTAFNEHGFSEKSVLWPKGRQDLRFERLLPQLRSGLSILDYGCGLGHLYDYLSERAREFDYIGVDVCDFFVDACRSRIQSPKAQFVVNQIAADIALPFDWAVCSGTFNILYNSNESTHWQIVRSTLLDLLTKARIGVAVNFMTTKVDFKHENAFHLDPLEALRFILEECSGRGTIDCSYMPYEFTVKIWKDTSVLRPQNTYNLS